MSTIKNQGVVLRKHAANRPEAERQSSMEDMRYCFVGQSLSGP